MNKVTKDLMKWFPNLDAQQAFSVQMELMNDGIDFSEVSNKDLKNQAKQVISSLFVE